MGFRKWSLALAFAIATAHGAAGCVLTSTHEKVLADLSQTRNDLKQTLDALEQRTQERDALSGEKATLESSLANSQRMQRDLESQLTKVSADLRQLFAEKGEVEDEKARLASRIKELGRLSEALERRAADYRKLLEKLGKMMDAGTLSVRIRNGMMVVQMSSDIVFPPGGIRIKRPAREALEELALTLASFEGRRFQVVGHCDNQPIRTKRFPSNWELSTQRSVEVVKLLVDAGVEPTAIGAAGAAEFDPVADNAFEEGRASNRRVEIVFVPKIDEMPGFKEVLEQKTQPAPAAAPEAAPEE